MLRSPQAMHIPDGFLSGLVLAVCWGISAIVIVVCLHPRQARHGRAQSAVDGRRGRGHLRRDKCSTSRWQPALPATCWARL